MKCSLLNPQWSTLIETDHQDDVHQQLTALEGEFYQGEFVKVYHEANAIFKRMHVEDTGTANG